MPPFPESVAWSFLTGVVAAGVLGLTAALARGHDRAPGRRLPLLGAPTLVTLGRGLLVAAVAGFLAIPPDPQRWLPAVLYGTATALDAVDGALARRLDRVSELGAALDERFDTAGLVVAPTLAVTIGQLPVWYLAVPAAKPTYLATVWLWRRGTGETPRPLPPSRLRRPLATTQMCVTVVALAPPVGPPLTIVVATAAVCPFLARFVADWLAVTGLR